MFSVKVLKLKDIIKYLVGFIITIFVVILLARYFNSIIKEKNIKKDIEITEQKIVDENNKLTSKKEQENEDVEQEEKNNNGKENSKKNKILSFQKFLNSTIPTISIINEEYNKEEIEEIQKTSYAEKILDTELSVIKGIKRIKTTDINNTNENEEQEEMKLANNEKTNTEIVTPNPITENYNVQYGNVKIKNQTTYDLTEDILKPDIKIDNKNVLIFHTHSCESYTTSEKYSYTQTRKFSNNGFEFYSN